MTAHHHHQATHRHATHHHPHRFDAAPSLLRMSAWERLGGVAVVIAALWAALAWAMT